MDRVRELALKQKLIGLAQSGQLVEAEKFAIKLSKKLPKDDDVRFVLGQIQLKMCKLENAKINFSRVTKNSVNNYLDALKYIADICLDVEDHRQGVEATKKWLKIEPDSPLANYQHGFFQARQKQVGKALKHFSKAVELAPQNPDFPLSLAELLAQSGSIDESLIQFEKIKSLNENDDRAYIKSLLTQNYSATLSDESVYKEHVLFGQRIEARYSKIEPFCKREANTRVRIAYVSADFRSHSVSYFFMPILEGYDRNKYEVYCYSDVLRPDAITKNTENLCDQWRDIRQLSDKQVYQLVRQDKIDILVDLIGYTGVRPRMEVYARKAAPIQVTYLGYPNTSGLSRMDYRIVDTIVDPVDSAESLNSETLTRMQNSFLCFSGEDGSPDIVDKSKGALAYTDKITLGSFNSYLKITDEMISAWSTILRLTPNSQLYVKAEVLTDDYQAKMFIERCNSLGINSEKLIVSGQTPGRQAHFREYHKVDLHLDTYPYNGTTTTFEALWMGVPTVTLAGKSHRSRVGKSILSNLDMDDFVANSIEDYIKIAVAKVGNINDLREQRLSYRNKLKESVLMDSGRFIKEYESLLEEMLRQKSTES